MVLWVILFIFLCCYFPFLPFLLSNMHKIAYWSVKDLKLYIHYRRWNECNVYGHIYDYTGLFGSGKTKEVVRYIVSLYERYNDKWVYDFDNHDWVKQKIVVYSNVHFKTIPYVFFSDLQQIIDCKNKSFGEVSIFFCDEASVIFNSRNFKSNIPLPVLNHILTCRHHKIALFLDSQRFNHLDALLRQVTVLIFDCAYFKPLRIQRIRVYDAEDIENCINLNMVKPLQVMYSHTPDEVYQLYDTNAVVEDINRRLTSDTFHTNEEILAAQGNTGDWHMVNHKGKTLTKMTNKGGV